MMGVFRTNEGREKVHAAYRAILGHFPITQRYVDTLLGRTFLIEAGAADAPPVVLLHGSCGNSAFWLGDVFQLADRFRVLAVDIIGEAGLSDEQRPNLESDAYVRWLEAVLDGIGAPRVALVGNSFGGWLALKFAIARPERVAKLAAVVPSGVAPPSGLFQTESLRKNLEGSAGRSTLNKAVTEGADLPEPVADFLHLIGENFRPMTEPLPLFADEALKSLEMPVFFAFSGQDATMDARAAAARAQALLPRADVRLLEQAGHVVTNIGEIVLPFLSDAPEFHILENGGARVAIIDRWARIRTPQDMLDAMATAGYLGCRSMAVYAESLGEGFFDLKTGIAGELLQKFSNYHMRVAIIGDFSKYESRSLRDFIRESNKGKTVCFVDSLERALGKLAGETKTP